VLPDSLVSITCTPYSKHAAGDHLLLIGHVQQLRSQPGDPLVHCARKFWGLRLPTPDIPSDALCFAA
jgi:flavin reductase (DIM6/NTAB) family NADH-FMN oxidoreductase RutF